MRILVLLSKLDQTGMTTHTLDLVDALIKLGHKVTVLVGFGSQESDVSQQLMVRFVETGAKIRKYHPSANSSKYKLVRSAISLLFNILMVRSDVIHVQSPYLSWAPWLLRRKFVSTLHVADLKRCFYYKNATHLIAISNETKEYAKRVFYYKDDEITIINHGVSSDFSSKLNALQIAQERSRLNLPTDKLLLLVVGSIEPRKGQDVLLKSVAKLRKEYLDKIHIVFLGSDKNEDKYNTRWLEQSIKSTGTTDLVSHFEYQDPKIFYKISDVFILPSWLEGFPLVVIEAMLSGNLCIRTDSEGAFEQIIDGKNGYIFPKGDVTQLSEILGTVIADDELRLKMSEEGRNYALAHFTSNLMAKNTLSVYKMISK